MRYSPCGLCYSGSSGFALRRILDCLPFFCPAPRVILDKKQATALKNKFFCSSFFFLLCSFLPLQKWDYSLFRGCLALLALRAVLLRLVGLRPPSNPYGDDNGGAAFRNPPRGSAIFFAVRQKHKSARICFMYLPPQVRFMARSAASYLPFNRQMLHFMAVRQKT